MIEEFNQLPWHDSVLLEMRINRDDPGNRDRVELVVSWHEDRRQRLIFEDCYRLYVDMNFGVIAPDSIDAASATMETEDVAQLVQEWRAIGAELDGLARYEIRTSSTGSSIQIFARSYRLEDADLA